MPQCFTCTNATMCTSCSSSLYRSLSSTNLCPCISLYFDVNGTCSTCIYECSTCNSATTCTTCSSSAFRSLNSANRCPCINNYYDDGTHMTCLACSYACLTCVTTALQCVTCDTTLRVLQNNWCACPQYFYDKNSTVACGQCQYTCSTCKIATTCFSCDISKFRQFDSINQYCVCIQGYYDDGSN